MHLANKAGGVGAIIGAISGHRVPKKPIRKRAARIWAECSCPGPLGDAHRYIGTFGDQPVPIFQNKRDSNHFHVSGYHHRVLIMSRQLLYVIVDVVDGMMRVEMR